MLHSITTSCYVKLIEQVQHVGRRGSQILMEIYKTQSRARSDVNQYDDREM